MGDQPLYSIGHGSRQADVFLELLQRYDIQYLADVRSKPYSRFHPQYSRPALEKFTKVHKIDYMYMGDELGGRPADPSCYNKQGKIDYNKLNKKDFYLKGIERLHLAYKKKLQGAIMCSERDPRNCHRCLLIGNTLLEQGIDLCHIDTDGNIVRQSELLLKTGDKKNPDLFDL